MFPRLLVYTLETWRETRLGVLAFIIGILFVSVCVGESFRRLYGRLSFWRSASQEKEKELDALRLRATLAEERYQSVQDLQAMMNHHIKGLCAETLEKTSADLMKRSEGFLARISESTEGKLSGHAQTMTESLKPLRESLSSMNAQIVTLEKQRVGAYEGLSTQLKGMADVHQALHKQTGELVQALKTPHARGRWGEIQLRRLVEWAGMLPFCDFLEQATLEGQTGPLRPDLVIRLPQDRFVIVDAKVPLATCFHGEKEGDENLKEGVKKIKHHIHQLAARGYTEISEKTPDFILLFLPTEGLLIKALEVDPSLFDYSAEKAVLLVTPMTMIALLKVIALGWQQEKISENAQEIATLGKELSRAFASVWADMQTLGKAMRGSIKAYNSAYEGLAQNVLPKAKELGQLNGEKSEQLKVQARIKKMPLLEETGALAKDAG